MTYEQLIETVSLIVENEKIVKSGLSLTYELNEEAHRKLDEVIFIKLNPWATSFTHLDEFEVNIGGILVKFVKTKTS